MYLSGFGGILLATGTFVSAATIKTNAAITKTNATTTSSGILAVESPKWLPDFPIPSGVNSGYPTGPLNLTDSLPHTSLKLSAYPEPWAAPKTDHPEIKAVVDAIDWTKVPDAPIRKANSAGDIVMTGYDSGKDPYCWWSDTNCVKPKASYLPADFSICPRAGDWGLNYDDGPLNPTGDKETDKWAEPELYNFLAKNGNQKATLFYIGSNVATFPEAAKRAINDGHVLCVHTWSHPQMTTQTNIQVVAQLYWTLRAIKEATGVTTKCWRPPYGDVDDRVRAIAWQMGMQTMLWDEDTNDWGMPGEGGGKLPPATVDGYFQGWIDARKKGTDKHGHIVLEHELNNSTVQMTEKWLGKLQESFNVVSIQQCMNISQPYWENNWVYPTEKDNTTTVANTTSTINITLSSYIPATAASTASASTVKIIYPASASSSISLNTKNSSTSPASFNTVNSASLLALVASSAAAYYFF